jgi:hypothetical protein
VAHLEHDVAAKALVHAPANESMPTTPGAHTDYDPNLCCSTNLVGLECKGSLSKLDMLLDTSSSSQQSSRHLGSSGMHCRLQSLQLEDLEEAEVQKCCFEAVYTNCEH